MKIIFLGTGGASDKGRRNTSILLESETAHHLLDCGFSSVHSYLAHDGIKVLKTIWISHYHGDHFFGIPQLIVHYYLNKREEQLTICSGTDPRDKILKAIDLAYPGLPNKLSFPIEFRLIAQGEKTYLNDLEWQSAPVSHTDSSFALQVKNPSGFSLYYSGDGKPTLEAIKLIKQCKLIIHEAYSMSPTKMSHSSIEECLLWAKELQMSYLALVHMNDHTRNILAEKNTDLTAPAGTQLILPEDGDFLEF